MTKDRLDQLRANSTNNNTKKIKSPPVTENNEEDEETETTALTGQSSLKAIIVKSKNNDKNELDKAYQHVNSINEWLALIQEDVVQLKRYHVRMQQSTRTDPSIRDQVNSITESIKGNSMKIKNALQELEKEKKGDEDKVMFRVVKTQHTLLSKRFRETMLDYENTLSAHKKICEDIIKRQLHIAERDVSDEELGALLDAEDTAVFVDNFTKETLEARRTLEDARDRHKEILALEKDIEAIRDMFFDIALHVSQQGELIDRIEYHIGNGCVLTEKGSRKLSKAEKYMLKARKKKCWIIICLSSVIGILLFVIVLQMSITPG